MLGPLAGFDWDVHKGGHIAAHGVLKGREKRWKLFGKTAAGRYLVVVSTLRRKRFRTVTAYTMNQSEWRVYAPEIEG